MKLGLHCFAPHERKKWKKCTCLVLFGFISCPIVSKDARAFGGDRPKKIMDVLL